MTKRAKPRKKEPMLPRGAGVRQQLRLVQRAKARIKGKRTREDEE